MRRSRITITLDSQVLKKIDQLIDKKQIRNRSHAIEFILQQYTQHSVKKAVILAGGRGTHLLPYTYEIPKPLLPVQGTPILEHLVIGLKNNGITDIIITISHLGEKIKSYFGDGSKWGVSITYSEEQESLNTGGAIKKIKHLVDQETFLVIHGDIMTNFAFSDLIKFHEEQDSIATVALTTSSKPMEFGQFKLHGSKLVQFYPNTDKPELKSHLIHCGIYAFKPSIFDYFPKNKKSFALEDVLQELIPQEQVNGFVFEGTWFDVGNPENYERAIKEFKK
ncbi:MAG: sugar phosphate nucleotidyltransferase [Weeksellaceae bacterium]